MKKFLFTLVALLAAGSMFADEYLYIEDQDLTGEVGNEVELTLKAHFPNAVSAFQVDFVFPDGLELLEVTQGADTHVSYLTARGRAATSNPLFLFDYDHNNMICAQADQGYYYNEDGELVTHNCVKWIGQEEDYEEMAILLFEVKENFQGGEILVITEPSCDSGQVDPRPEYVNCEEGQHHEVAANVGPQETPTPDATKPEITFTPSAGGVTVDIDPYTSFTITVNGVVVENPVLPLFVEAEYDMTKVIAVEATNAPEGYNPASNSDEYTLQPKQKEQNSKPSVTYSYDNGELTVWAYGCTEEGVTYTLYCDGVEYTGEMPIEYDIYEGYNHVWTATAVSPTTTVSEVSDECPIVIEAVTPTYVTPDPEITVVTDPETGVVTITVTGEGTVTAKVTTSTGTTNYTDEDGDGTIVITLTPGEYEDYANVYATATANKPGYDVTPGENQATMIYVAAKTAKPTIDVVTNADGTVTVTVTGEGTLNVLIEGYELEADVITYTGVSPYEITLQQAEDAQEVTVSATAQGENKIVSDYAVKTFEIEAKTEVVPDPLTGEIIIGEVNQENGQFEVTYNGPEAVTLNVNITPVRATSNTYQLAERAVKYNVVATASAEGYITKDASAIRIWKGNVDAPVITTSQDANNVYVTITWPVTDSEGEHIYTGQAVYPRGDADQSFDVTAYVAATELYNEGAHCDYTVVVPAKEAGTPALPASVNGQITGYETATITITNRQDGGTVHYTITNMTTGEEVESGTFTDDEFVTNVTGAGTYYVVTYVTADGYTKSAETTLTFSILEGETAVRELIDGKAIANVRYFNMAGQEMTEANGVTIVVTTYTDGTTSAVKVMK